MDTEQRVQQALANLDMAIERTPGLGEDERFIVSFAHANIDAIIELMEQE